MCRHGGPRQPPAPWALLCLALLATAGSQASQQCQEQDVAADGELRLQPETPPWEWVTIEWYKALDEGSRQRVLGVEKDEVVVPAKGPYRGRAFFQPENVSLWISPVSPADSGVYSTIFESASGSSFTRCFHVWVSEPTGQPRLEARVLRRELGLCNLSLACTMPAAGNEVSYNLSCAGNLLGAWQHQAGLHVQVYENADPIVCYCNTSNPVSWSLASIDVVAACRSAASGPLGVILSSAVAATLVLVLALLLFCWWRKRGKTPGGHSEQALTIYEEVGKTQTGPNPNGTSEATVGGNTIYAVVCTKAQEPTLPQEPESRTIYSTVQPTRKSPSLKKKRLNPALVSTAYVEITGTGTVGR